MRLVDLKEPNIKALYDGWTKDGKFAQAHGLVTMLRQLVHFGANKLEDQECVRLSVILRNMHFKQPKARTDTLTADQANAIRVKAHAMGLHSLALAQAFQFDCTLRQRDVIGEWVPIAESGMSDVMDRGDKWIRGLRWEEIDEEMILRHVTNEKDKEKELVVDLKLAPMVMEELKRLPAVPKKGPVVVREYDNLPWTDHDFRRAWRKVAEACDIPKNVRNADSRPRAASNEKSPAAGRVRKDAELAPLTRH
jgi:hypothetical protein